MKILYIGGYQQKNIASRYYDVGTKLTNGFIRNGHCVLRLSDRDIARSKSLLNSKKRGTPKANLEIQKIALEFNPDLVIFMHADVVSYETVKFIRDNCAAKCVQINVDGTFVAGNRQRVIEHAKVMDACFITTDGKILKEFSQASNGTPFYFMPNPVDKSIECHQAFKLGENKHQHDLFFAYGSASGDPRVEIASYINEKLPQLKTKFCIAGQGTGLWGADYIDTLGKSYMGINGSRYHERDEIGEDKHLYRYSSDRIAHYMGNGLLTFSHERFKMHELFNSDEMITYKNNDDLVKKLAYFMGNQSEGKAIAKRGWEKIHREYSEKKIAQLILDKLGL